MTSRVLAAVALLCALVGAMSTASLARADVADIVISGADAARAKDSAWNSRGAHWRIFWADAAGHQIWTAQIAGDGSLSTPSAVLQTDVSVFIDSLSAAYDPQRNDYVLAWGQSDGDGYYGSGGIVRGVRVAANGAAMDSPFPISPVTPSGQKYPDHGEPAAEYNPAREQVEVVWSKRDGSGSNIYSTQPHLAFIHRSQPQLDGAAQYYPVNVHSYNGSRGYAVAVNADGETLMAYLDQNEVHARVVDLNGHEITAPRQLAGAGASHPTSVNVAWHPVTRKFCLSYDRARPHPSRTAPGRPRRE